MKPIKFPGHNMTLAENQPEYLPLPVCYHGGPEGPMTSCWQLTFWERIKILIKGRIHLTQLTFGRPLQPQRPEIDWKEPICKGCGNGISLHDHIHRECPTQYKEGARVLFYNYEFNDGVNREGTVTYVDGVPYVKCEGVHYTIEKFIFFT